MSLNFYSEIDSLQVTNKDEVGYQDKDIWF